MVMRIYRWLINNRVVNFRIICLCFWNYLSRASELVILDFADNCPSVLALSVHANIMLRKIYPLTDVHQFLHHWKYLCSGT